MVSFGRYVFEDYQGSIPLLKGEQVFIDSQPSSINRTEFRDSQSSSINRIQNSSTHIQAQYLQECSINSPVQEFCQDEYCGIQISMLLHWLTIFVYTLPKIYCRNLYSDSLCRNITLSYLVCSFSDLCVDAWCPLSVLHFPIIKKN